MRSDEIAGRVSQVNNGSNCCPTCTRCKRALLHAPGHCTAACSWPPPSPAEAVESIVVGTSSDGLRSTPVRTFSAASSSRGTKRTIAHPALWKPFAHRCLCDGSILVDASLGPVKQRDERQSEQEERGAGGRHDGVCLFVARWSCCDVLGRAAQSS